MRALLLSLALSACGAAVPETSPELVEYGAIFEREANLRGLGHKAVPMVLVKEFSVGQRGKHVQGLCIVRGASRWIEIREGFVKASFRHEVEMLVMHEQGHCALGLSHSDSLEAEIMGKDLMPSSLFKNNRDAVLDELFYTVQK